jgi:hypothetical protein
MLTGFQTEVVAFIAEGGILCPACAVAAYAPLPVSMAERGFACGHDLSPLSRYCLDEYVSESASEYVSEEIDYTVDPEGWDTAFEALLAAGHPCDSCSEAIS